MKRATFYGLLFTLSHCFLNAQTAHDYLRAADKAYERNKFENAASFYEGADKKDPSAQAKYNKGNALYQLGDLKGAADMYEQSLQESSDDGLTFRNYHNLGNVFAQQKEYQKAVEAYKNALKVNPNDIGTKKNLVRALQQIPPQQQQKKERSSEGQEKSSKNEKKEEQPADQKQQQESQNEKQQSSSIANKELSEEEMQRLLKAVENEDQAVQKKLKKKSKEQSSRPVKDW